MKREKLNFFKTGFMVLCLAVAVSCNEDEPLAEAVANNTDTATCTDGVKNGDETGVDCGGTCNPCDDGMELGRRAELYVTNNANGDITKYSVTGDSLTTFTTSATAAEGIYFDKDNDLLVQASRSDLRLDAYSGTSLQTADTAIDADFSSAADLESPRELAVSGSTYVVSDNGSNKFFVYSKNGDSFSLTSTVQIPFAVWGITFKGKDLYAVVDKSNELAVFNNFESSISSPTCDLNPSKRIAIEGIVRTHGLTYNGKDDVMIMTDIGDAANGTDDGGFHVISDFSNKFDVLSDGELLPLGMQLRVAGPSTLLGNPIDVAYDSETKSIYISEVGNGKVLGYTIPNGSGDLAPDFNKDLPAASSIYFSSDETDGDVGTETVGQRTILYATSTANGDITVYDGNCTILKTVTSASASSEGIYYDPGYDAVIQASRSELELQYYDSFSNTANGDVLSPDFTSTNDLMSPREIAVRGDKVVVADNGENKFFVYSYDGTSFTLRNTFIFECKGVWGITFKGDDLLAVIDNTSDLAVFSDFLTKNTVDGNIFPDKTITIEGIVRTHGIDYSESDDVLVMTDIGDAANGTDDGSIRLIMDFSARLEAIDGSGTIPSAEQIWIGGPATMLGNPIDVAYDHKTRTVYIAEIGNGKILGFSNALNGSGEFAPTFVSDLDKASSIYLYNN